MHEIIFKGINDNSKENRIDTIELSIKESNNGKSEVIFINEVPKIFKINNQLAVYGEYINGLGWMFGISIIDKLALISENYIIESVQDEFSGDYVLIIKTEEKPFIDGVYGDKKVELKNILNKYGLDLDNQSLSSLLDDVSKFKND